MLNLSSLSVQFVPGVGEKRAALLESELMIRSQEDLLYCIPYRYVDRTKIYKISEIDAQLSYIQVKARIKNVQTIGEGKAQRVTARAYDDSGSLELVWFKGIKYIKNREFRPDAEFLIFGQPSLFNGHINIVHPEITLYETSAEYLVGFQAIYPSTERLKRSFITSKSISKFVAAVFDSMHDEKLPETLPAWFIEKRKLMYRHDALHNIHFPESEAMLKRATARLKFEELFYIQLHILQQKYRRKSFYKGHIFSRVGDYFNKFYSECLPFPLTNAQKRVIREIRNDCKTGKQMNRLLQGDVGSGKTIVALLCMLIAIDNGFQAALMAPTEILATQHYESLKEMLAPLDITVSLLTGSTKQKDRKGLLESLKNGELNILIGTHALLEEGVIFDNVGFVVIDEQHRFGVAQRSKMWLKNRIPPHVLVMTATPIPRTLAMTVYGDLDVSVIDELPPGRKPIRTMHAYEERRDSVFEFIEKELRKGRQAYIVFPMIYESERSDMQNLENGFERTTEYFGPKGFTVGMVHGKMKGTEKDEEMRRFVEHETDILVSTTVIEVGVNVPNASVMVIEGASRFGLAQLHQLRGRVGRGADQSFCILMTPYKLSADSRKRIETMTSTNDGFEIAEVDMKLRGPGDIEGTRQSGLVCDLKVANLARDGLILNEASAAADEILREDPELEKGDNLIFANRLKELFTTFDSWYHIS